MSDFLSDLMRDIRRNPPSPRRATSKRSQWVFGRVYLLYNMQGECLGYFREWTRRRPLGRRFTRDDDQQVRTGWVEAEVLTHA